MMFECKSINYQGLVSIRCYLFLTIICLVFASCNSNEETDNGGPAAPVTPLIQYQEVDYFLHDTSLFTEGLLMHNGQLFESTGSPDSNFKSLIGVSDLAKRNFTQKVALNNKKYFGEGIVFFGDSLFPLTYKNQTGFIYDANSFKFIDTFKYQNKEGWGLTTDGNHIIMSDGTDSLTYISPKTLKADRYLRVTENGVARDSLNELEFIKGYLYANVWLTNHIVKIDPANGKVVGRIDFSPLVFKARFARPYADVLNGIAYDSTNNYVYVTGKLWPYIYQIKLLP
jgi:glutaminyl-peptide cyclotransferase